MINSKQIVINNEEYSMINNYKENDKYRQSLNKLARKTYGFDFEDWYQQGFWGGKYCPYSLLHQDKIVANVSVNPIDFLINGERKHTIQLGTVMTEEAYRNRGLIRELMTRIMAQFENSCDLFYLYANDTVLNFYPKFGFMKSEEYFYTGTVKQKGKKLTYRKLNICDSSDRSIITRLVSNTIPAAACQMLDNASLVFFYLLSFLSEQIYYFEEIDLLAVAEIGENSITLSEVFSEKPFDINSIASSLCEKESTELILGFTPLDTSAFSCKVLKEEGSTFFMKGTKLFRKGRFPVLSHA
jgi:Predicted acetyltransferase